MHINFSLPFQEPVLVFAIILFIILFAPLLLKKINIPPIIGMIIAGMLVGPNGFNLLLRNSSVELFGTVGLLYIMFLAGLEIDLHEFKKNRHRSIVFGVLTFSIPMLLGTCVFFYFLNYSLISSILIASMFASHTLVTYPIVSKLGITKNPAVNVAIGGTLITDTAALLVLAVIAGSATGQLDSAFWLQLTISIVIFALVVLVGFPLVGRWFFKRSTDNVAQYIFVLGMVFFASFLALVAGIEAIIGAFLAGLALNRLIPHTSPLMNRIEFVGNALFIPFFLIGVGMLVDYRVLIASYDALLIALIMSAIATVSKYLAAKATQKSFKFTKDQGTLIFGLSNSQAAATLAAVLIGYNIILGETESGQVIRLLNEDILNGTIIMILVTCTIASFATQKSAINIAKSDLKADDLSNTHVNEDTLVGISDMDTIESLIQLAVCTMNMKTTKEIYGLNVISNEKESPEKVNKAKTLMLGAEKYAASVDLKLHPLIRYDLNIASGIINTVKEKKIKHFYISLHKKTSPIDSFFGRLTSELLDKNDSTIYIYKQRQPLNTIKKFVLVIPANAELEPGFQEWCQRILQIARNTGITFEVFASHSTIKFLKDSKAPANLDYNEMDDFEDFLIISRFVDNDTMIIVNMARKDGISHQQGMEKISDYLHRYFPSNNFLLVYPNSRNKMDNTGSMYDNGSLKENLLKLKDTAESLIKGVMNEK